MTNQENKSSINFNTENLITIHYPREGGGKFINMALALHPNILFQHELLAKAKIAGKLSLTKSFETVMWTFDEKVKTGNHVEFDNFVLSGFNRVHLDNDITADEKQSNQLWRELTNQQKFYFLMTDHKNGSAFRRYIKRKILKLINFDWILKLRQSENNESTFEDRLVPLSQAYIFDMETIKESNLFLKEINKVFNYLGLDQPHDETFAKHLEELRKGFLKTCKIGFGSNDASFHTFNRIFEQ
jgi:hypothetical protein